MAPLDAKFLRAGSLAAIVGAFVLFTATFLHPLPADPGDPVAAFAVYAADDLWVASHMGQFFGVLLMATGLIALHQALTAGGPNWPARLGLHGAVVSVAAAAALQAVDGVALKAVVDAWAGAPPEERSAAFRAAFVVRQIEVGAASFVAILFGITVSLFGAALVASPDYPRWLGWLGLVGGIGTLGGGLLTAHTGFSVTAMNLTTMPFNLIVVIWVIAIGVYLWRQAARISGTGGAS